MPRKPRFFLSNVPVHIVQRGLSREPVFFESQDYATYAYWMKESSQRYDVAIHAFVLMTNHVHMLVTPKIHDAVSPFMQFLGRRYVPYINFKYGRSGTIWEGRFKASLVQEEAYFLKVMRYIELNPVRAGMVKLPGHYRWSSFCHNSGARKNSFIREHSLFSRLGLTVGERHKAYSALFSSELDVEDEKQISEAWLSGTPLGNDYFKEKVERELSRKVGQARRGRPLKKCNKGL